VLAEGTIDEIKANEQVIEAYLGTGLKNKDKLEEIGRMSDDPYQDDRGNKDRSITKAEGGGVHHARLTRHEGGRAFDRGLPDRRHHVGRLRRGAGHPA
jgi:hypothetical protein